MIVALGFYAIFKLEICGFRSTPEKCTFTPPDALLANLVEY